MSLLVVVVGCGNAVPLGGKACANTKLTQSSRSEQGCSILDLNENKSKRSILRSNYYYIFFPHVGTKLKEKAMFTLDDESFKTYFILSHYLI